MKTTFVKALTTIALVSGAALASQEIDQFDVCVVAIGENFEAALLTTVIAKQQGMPFVDLDKGSLTNAEMSEMIRWKLKRSTPFRIEEAVIAHHVLSHTGPNVRCVAALIKRRCSANSSRASRLAVVSEYSVCATFAGPRRLLTAATSIT